MAISARVTFGMQIEVPLPIITDAEGDPIRKTFRDSKNTNLPIYESEEYDPVTGQTVLMLKSEILEEGKNARVGNSTINLSWMDMTTGVELRLTVNVEIMRPADWKSAFLSGEISRDGNQEVTKSEYLAFLFNLEAES